MLYAKYNKGLNKLFSFYGKLARFKKVRTNEFLEMIDDRDKDYIMSVIDLSEEWVTEDIIVNKKEMKDYYRFDNLLYKIGYSEDNDKSFGNKRVFYHCSSEMVKEYNSVILRKNMEIHSKEDAEYLEELKAKKLAEKEKQEDKEWISWQKDLYFKD